MPVVELSPALARPPLRGGEQCYPERGQFFTGFVFKIQANMDPKHRDHRIAFLRVCSDRLSAGMKVKQVAGGRLISVNNAITFAGARPRTTDEAFPATSLRHPGTTA